MNRSSASLRSRSAPASLRSTVSRGVADSTFSDVVVKWLQGEDPAIGRLTHDGIDRPGVGAAPGTCGVVNGHVSVAIDIGKNDKVANGGEIADIHQRDDGLSLRKRTGNLVFVGVDHLGADTEGGSSIAHERPLGGTARSVAVIVGPSCHRRWRVIGIAGEIDVDHREGCRSTRVVADRAASVGALCPHGVGLVEVGHRAFLPRLFGRGQGKICGAQERHIELGHFDGRFDAGGDGPEEGADNAKEYDKGNQKSATNAERAVDGHGPATRPTHARTSGGEVHVAI